MDTGSKYGSIKAEEEQSGFGIAAFELNKEICWNKKALLEGRYQQPLKDTSSYDYIFIVMIVIICFFTILIVLRYLKKIKQLQSE